VAKLAFSELNQRATELCVDLLGAEGMLIDGYEADRPAVISYTDGPTQYLFLRARANTIEGGTSEVQRNILSERVLGLPREPTRST
jgi:alkylation response protein AidB-like acyl-CoA dehydrogenase